MARGASASDLAEFSRGTTIAAAAHKSGRLAALVRQLGS
jgi:hypothetical protein